MSAYDAATLARGWLSVALAASKDKDRPALCRTVSIEKFPTGVRLVATDSYVLMWSWVPAVGHSTDPEPMFDEVPFAKAVAMDPHGRALGFFGHLLKMASGDDAEPIDVQMGLGVVEPLEDDDELTLGGMEARWVVLDYPDHERLRLLSYEGEFPTWRNILDNFGQVSTNAIAMNPEIVGRLAKLGRLHGNKPLVWYFGGDSKMALIEVGDSDPSVAGAVMPVRWNFDLNQPEVEVEVEVEPMAEPEAAEPEPVTIDAVSSIIDEAVRRINDGELGPDVTAERLAAE